MHLVCICVCACAHVCIVDTYTIISAFTSAEIHTQSSGAARRYEEDLGDAALYEGCGSFIGVCDPEVTNYKDT